MIEKKVTVPWVKQTVMASEMISGEEPAGRSKLEGIRNETIRELMVVQTHW